MRPLASFSASIGFQHAARRGFSHATRNSPLHTKVQRNPLTRRHVQIPRQNLRQSLRRGYADEAGPVVKPKRRFRILRWMWRITYLSALGGLVYVGYGIYQGKNPVEQHAPDPKKKTLVVLGMETSPSPRNAKWLLMRYRYWMGLCIAPQGS